MNEPESVASVNGPEPTASVNEPESVASVSEPVPGASVSGPVPFGSVIEFAATYYDGNSSRGWPVIARVVGSELRLEGPNAPLPIALAELGISPRLANTVRALSLPKGAKCETADNAAVDRLEQLTNTGRIWSLVHRLESHWRGAVIAGVLVFAVGVGGFRWGIPFLAGKIAQRLPEAIAYDLGKGTLAALDKIVFAPSGLSPQRQEELRSQFDRMAATYPELPLHLVFRSAMPNAFALPDGTVVVTDELVELAEHDEEVLSVLAHEIGHVDQRHALRMALESSAIGLLAFAYLGDATQLSGVAAALPAMYANAHYSRSHEAEADDFAFRHLTEARIPTERFSKILERMEKAFAGDNKGGTSYLSSHPPTPDRVARFRGDR